MQCAILHTTFSVRDALYVRCVVAVNKRCRRVAPSLSQLDQPPAEPGLWLSAQLKLVLYIFSSTTASVLKY